MAAQQSRLVRKKHQFFDFNWLPWQRPLRYQKRGPDRSYAPKTLSFGEKIAKIGPADLEIICLRKKDKKEKTKNAWQSLAYSPLDATVSPPSRY